MLTEILFLIAMNTTTYTEHVKPIVEKRCTPCHTGQMDHLPNFLNYQTAFEKRFVIKERVYVKRDMPIGYITEEEREIIKDWVDSGGKE